MSSMIEGQVKNGKSSLMKATQQHQLQPTSIGNDGDQTRKSFAGRSCKIVNFFLVVIESSQLDLGIKIYNGFLKCDSTQQLRDYCPCATDEPIGGSTDEPTGGSTTLYQIVPNYQWSHQWLCRQKF